ncbi:SusD/RagB family nutrient-binding outer membrane lipoprotein [Puteibacter caeruleilacunae]|nr:SusD/RagB family nutrient-binding outer membrane lipoprotein [Puteibacter caeruleilacunae]
MKTYKFLILFLVVAFGACTDDFDEMNTNPIEPTEVQADLLFPRMLKVPYGGWEFQTGHNLFSNHFAQYIANTAPYFHSDRYTIPNGWSMPIWNYYYTNILPNCLYIEESLADDPKSINKIQQAIIWKVHQAQFVTDHYGDVPYFEAGKQETDLDYDTQKDIYYSFFDELESAASKLDGDASLYNYGAQDYLYNGNAMKWKKFANSLRLRYALRIAEIDPTKAKAEAVAALNAGLFESNDDNAALDCTNGDLTNGHNFRAIANWNEFRLSSTFFDILTETSDVIDPRMYAYFIPGRGTGTYAGIDNGIPVGDLGDANEVFSNIGPAIVKEREYMIMNYSEVCFLKAEAALRGWTEFGSAQEHYEAGIAASFAYWDNQIDNETPADMLTLGVNSNEVPYMQSQFSMLVDGNLLGDPADYLAGGDVPFKTAGSTEEKLRQIITQKYIANFPDGMESWCEFRRTGYPSEIKPVVAPVAGSLPQGEFIQKLPYVDQEYDLNETHASDSQNNGGQGDGIGVKLWWVTD